MNKIFTILLLFIIQMALRGQIPNKPILNKGYDNIPIHKEDSLVLLLNFQKGCTYQIWVQQMGIDVVLTLRDDKGKKLVEQDSPNGSHGFEIFDHKAIENQSCKLIIKKFEQEGNANSGLINYYIKEYTPKEIALQEQTVKELSIENQKHVLTLDIDHFWQAFDNLTYCKTRWDSTICFQNLYLNRGTDGLKDFINAREWSPGLFVNAANRLNKYYISVRPYTYKVKDSEPFIEEVDVGQLDIS